MRIAHSKPTIASKDIAGIRTVLQSGSLSQGEKVAEFEARLAGFLELKHAVAVNSGTSALHLSLLALGVGPGHEVILPSYVCSALLNAVGYTGASPRIVDVDPDTFNIAPAEVKKAINRKTRVVIVPHMFGNPAPVKELVRLGVPVLEDCAQALGAGYLGEKAGCFGVLSVCSFYATKMMTTGEGGMVLGNDRRLLEKIRDWRVYDNRPSYQLRFNYKMTDLQAALGLSQIKRLSSFIKTRREIAKTYNASFGNLPVSLPCSLPGSAPVFFRYVIKVRKGKEQLKERLRQKGINAADPVFKPLHRYLKQDNCPVSDSLMKECLSIPIYPGLTGKELKYIVGSLGV